MIDATMTRQNIDEKTKQAKDIMQYGELILTETYEGKGYIYTKRIMKYIDRKWTLIQVNGDMVYIECEVA